MKNVGFCQRILFIADDVNVWCGNAAKRRVCGVVRMRA